MEKLIKSIADTNRRVQNDLGIDIGYLYKQLQDEETKELLKRLEEVPEDVGNLSYQLFSREMNEESFDLLRNAYMKLMQNKDASDGNKRSYLLLFSQHFMGLSILDKDLRDDIISNFEDDFSHAFKNDMIKSTKDLYNALNSDKNKMSVAKRESILKEFLRSLNESKYKNLNELKCILEQELTSKTLLSNVLQKLADDGISIALFKAKHSK